MNNTQKLIKCLAIALAVALTVGIVSGLLKALTAVAGITSLVEGTQQTDKAGTLEAFGPFEGITSLDMEIGAADIRIEAGQFLSAGTDNPYIEVSERNGTLVIREKSHIADLEGSIFILYVPGDMVFDRVELTTGAGRIEAERLSCRRLDMELGAGKAEFAELNVSDEADIEGGAGQVIISSGSLNDLSFEMGIGEGIVNASLTGKSEINAGIGSLRLQLAGTGADYTIRCEQGIGQIQIDGQTVSGNTTIGSGPERLEVEGGIGNITIEFADRT